jgi:hypothetical protein
MWCGSFEALINSAADSQVQQVADVRLKLQPDLHKLQNRALPVT